MSEAIDKLYESKVRLRELGVNGTSMFLSPKAKNATIDDIAKDLLVFTSFAELLIKDRRSDV